MVAAVSFDYKYHVTSLTNTHAEQRADENVLPVVWCQLR